jgi:hypothetical protein
MTPDDSWDPDSAPNPARTRGTFTLTGIKVGRVFEKSGRMLRVCYVKGDDRLLALWGQSDGNRTNIDHLDEAAARHGFPLLVQCDWGEPSDEAKQYNNGYVVSATDDFAVIAPLERESSL